MKQTTTAVTLNASAGTINFGAVSGFAPGGLLAVFDLTAGRVLYSPTQAGTWIGSVLTVRAVLDGLTNSDAILAIYDDGISAAREAGGNLATIASHLAGTLSVADAANAAFAGVVAMTATTVYAAQRSVGVLATVSGNLTFTFPDASTITLPVYAGWQTLPFAVTSYSVPVSGGATASVYNLK